MYLFTTAWEFILKIMAFFMAYFFLPYFFLFTALPLAILRQIAILTSGLRPDLKNGVPISPISGMLCVDDYYHKSKNNEAAILYTDQKIDVETARERIRQVLDCGRFPELRMKLTRWLGFYFWGECDNFSIDNHVYECTTPNEMNEADMLKYHDFFTTKPWIEGRPFWEIVLFPQFKPSNGGSAFGLRIHHVLGDAFSLYHLFDAISDNGQGIVQPKSNHALASPKDHHKLLSKIPMLAPALQTIRQIFKIKLSKLILAPYHASYSILHDIEFNAWIKPERQRSDSTFIYETHELDLSYMKQVSKKTQIPLSQLVVAGTTAALRDAFQRLEDPVPKKLSCLYPLPAHGHTGGLTNQFVPSTAVLPVGEEDRKKRMQLIAEDFALKKEISWFQYYLVSAFSNSQQFFGPPLVMLPLCSLVISNFGFPPTAWKMFGTTVDNIIIHNELSYHPGMSVISMGYNGKLSLWIKCRTDICKNDEEPKRMATKFIQEIREIDSEASLVVAKKK